MVATSNLLGIAVTIQLASATTSQLPMTTIHFQAPVSPPGVLGDIAGARSVDGIQHVFQLITANEAGSGNGWHLATSSDYVHFVDQGIAIRDWPSGFVMHDVVNDELCAGMRTDSIPSVNGNELDSSMAMR